MRVSTTTFQNAFGKYLKSVVGGKEVIVTKNGRGVAKLIKYDDPMIHVMKEKAGEYIVRKRVTYEEYLEIVESTESRYELIDGEIYLMASPIHAHQAAVAELFGQLYNWFADKKCSPLTAPFDIRLHNDSESFEEDPNVVQPDIVVLCDDENIDEKGHYHGVPTLVVEVLSRSTRSKDMIKKMNLFMLSGVKEYWVVDPEFGNLNVYQFMDGDIRNYSAYKFGDDIASEIFDGLIIKTDKLIKS